MVFGFRSSQMRLPLQILAQLSLLFLSNLTLADNFMQTTFVKIETDTRQQAFNLSETLTEPVAIYIWDVECEACISNLVNLNQLSSTNSINAYALVKTSTPELPDSTLKRIESFKAVRHIYEPYAQPKNTSDGAITAKQSIMDYYRFLPQVRVYNAQGQLAAIYPKFNGQWADILKLLERLKTPEFADYSMQPRNIQASLDTKNNQGNLFNLVALPQQNLPLASEVQSVEFGPQLGAPLNRKFQGQALFTDHQPRLTKPYAASALFTTLGQTTTANWQGLGFSFAQSITPDSIIIINASNWLASDYEDQLMAPEAEKPKSQNLEIGYETLSDAVLYRASIFHETQDFREDQGFEFTLAHLFWNERVRLQLGSRIFSAEHDEFVTVPMTGKNRNQQYHIGVSFSINPTNRVAFDWHHDSFEGLIENPNELVTFGTPGGIGAQYTLYPNIRTQNSYTLQLINNARHYGLQYFEDTWSRERSSLFTRNTYHFEYIQITNTFSLSHQNAGVFFSDLFPFQNAQSLMTRSSSQADFDSLTYSLEGRYNLAKANGFRLWNKPTFLTFGLEAGYYSFDTLAEPRSASREPVSNFALTTAVGLEIAL